LHSQQNKNLTSIKIIIFKNFDFICTDEEALQTLTNFFSNFKFQHQNIKIQTLIFTKFINKWLKEFISKFNDSYFEVYNLEKKIDNQELAKIHHKILEVPDNNIEVSLLHLVNLYSDFSSKIIIFSSSKGCSIFNKLSF
jgi:superfamily II DNA/RNA helicase